MHALHFLLSGYHGDGFIISPWSLGSWSVVDSCHTHFFFLIIIILSKSEDHGINSGDFDFDLG